MDREENPQKTLVIFGVEGFLGQQAYIQATSPEFQKKYNWKVIGVSKREHPFSSFIIDITYKNKLQEFLKSQRIDYILWYVAKAIPSFSTDNESEAFRINVLPLENTTLPTYHGWEDNKRYIIEENTHDTIGFAQKVLNTLISAKAGTKWFIPADHKKSSHREMRDMLKGKDFAVFIVNGDGIELSIPGERGTIIEPKTDELNIQLKRMYGEHSLNQFPIAITGHFCITRGITISSEDFLIDGAILSNCQNK